MLGDGESPGSSKAPQGCGGQRAFLGCFTPSSCPGVRGGFLGIIPRGLFSSCFRVRSELEVVGGFKMQGLVCSMGRVSSGS